MLRNLSCRKRVALGIGLLPSVVLLTLIPAHSQVPLTHIPDARTQQQQDFDPRALSLLQQMADTYTHVSALEQRTEFYAAKIPLNPKKKTETKQDPKASGEVNSPQEPAFSALRESEADREHKARGELRLERGLLLRIAQPNRLLMERTETDPVTGAPNLSRWLSDGKTFWSYQSENGHYTREKAPRHLHDFNNLAHLNSGSLELLMVMGVNPFERVTRALDGAHVEGNAVVRNVPTDVVLLETVSPGEKTEVRLYIGHDDHLLRRLEAETTPTQAALAGDINALNGASEVGIATSGGIPMKSRVVYDNIISTDPAFDASTFFFTPPENALFEAPLDPTGKTGKARRQEQIADILKSLHPGKKVKSRTLRY